MNYPSRRQQKHTQKRYRVRSWREYDLALQRRGELTVWFSRAAIGGWKARSTGRPGGQRVYTRTAIEAALSVRLVYGLGLRQAEGLLAFGVQNRRATEAWVGVGADYSASGSCNNAPNRHGR